MFIQRQGLKCVLDMVIQVRVVEEILFRRPSLQVESFEPLDAGYAQRACTFRSQRDLIEAKSSGCRPSLGVDVSLLRPKHVSRLKSPY